MRIDHFHLKPRLAGIIILLFCLIGTYSAPTLHHPMRDKIFDTYQKLSPRVQKQGVVKVVEIDDQALSEYGQWPWPRHILAEIIQKLDEAGAAAIAIDIILSEPDRTSPQNAIQNWVSNEETQSLIEAIHHTNNIFRDHDLILAEALAKAPSVLQITSQNQSTLSECSAPLNKGKIVGMSQSALTSTLASYPQTITALPMLRAVAKGEGFARVGLEHDAIIRRAPIIALTCHGTQLHPSLALETLRIAAPRLQEKYNSFPTMRDKPCQINLKSIDNKVISHVSLCGLSTPLTEQGELWLHYTAPNAISKRSLSVKEVLTQATTDLFKNVDGKIVIIGATAEGLRDVLITPLGDDRPGAHIHAEIIEQILAGDTLFRASDIMRPLEIGISIFISILIITFLPRMSAISGIAIWIILILALGFSSFIVFKYQKNLIDPIYPVAVISFVFWSVTALSFQNEQNARKYVRSAFGKYLSPKIISQIEQNPQSLSLQGEIREITAFFSDIRGFTHLSETMSPQQVTGFLNEYFTAMSQIIRSHDGLIDKYIGDGLAAMWNAPLDVQMHPDKAGRAALAMIDRLDALNTQWKNRSDIAVENVSIGIGLHIGQANVGNLGSDDYIEYSMIGDVVNLTSRLEQASKMYDYPIIVSDDLRKRIPDFATIELGTITVKGRREETAIHALIGDEKLAQKTAFKIFEKQFTAAKKAAEGGQLNLVEDYLRQCDPDLISRFKGPIANLAKEKLTRKQSKYNYLKYSP